MTLSNMTTQERVIMRGMNRFLLKYTPFFVSVVYTLFCLLRALGFENYMVTSFLAYAGLMWAPFHFASSFASGFCRWHRRLIWYHGITGTMVFLEMWIGFGEMRRYLNVVFFMWGMMVCGVVAWKIYRGEFCCGRQHLPEDE